MTLVDKVAVVNANCADQHKVLNFCVLLKTTLSLFFLYFSIHNTNDTVEYTVKKLHLNQSNRLAFQNLN